MLLDLQILRKITLVLMEEKNWVSFTSFWKKDKNYTFLFQDKKKLGVTFLAKIPTKETTTEVCIHLSFNT